MHKKIQRSTTVLGRLLSYLSPYRTMVALTLVALLLATAAELTLPVVIKRTLDEHVLNSQLRLEVSTLKEFLNSSTFEEQPLSPQEAQALLQDGELFGSSLFLPPSRLLEIGGELAQQGREEGWIDAMNWHLFTSAPETAAIEESQPQLFLSQGDRRAILSSELSKLPPEVRRQLRQEDLSWLSKASLLYLGLLATVLIFTFAQVYAASWIGQRVMADLRQGLLGHVMGQSLSYLGRTPVGSLVSRVANDVETINEFFTNVTVSFLRDGAVMIGVVTVLFALDSRLALVALIALIPALFLIVFFRSRMLESFRKVRERVSAVNTYLSERISGMATLQLFTAQKRSRQEFQEKSDDLLDAELGQMRIMAVFRPIIDLISSTAVALIIWYAAGLGERNVITLGVLIAFVELLQKFFQPVSDIAEKFNILQSAMAGGERIFKLMDESEKIPDEGTHPLTTVQGNLQFESVHFSYVPGEPVLKGLNFSIPAGSTVAIVGATGSGKTTIANLLTRLWDPSQGRILLDGKDLTTLPLSQLRQAIQPVQQDVFLFAGTIAENIALGLPLDDQAIQNAARLARAHEFIQSLPQGYATPVAENASNLSAGQRQLIAFARIIAHDPALIILDEATANVDTATEHLLQEGLETLLEHRTALVIAHRLSTIRQANLIMVLGHGQVVESGTHEELMALNGSYRRLYEIQFAEEETTS